MAIFNVVRMCSFVDLLASYPVKRNDLQTCESRGFNLLAAGVDLLRRQLCIYGLVPSANRIVVSRPELHVESNPYAEVVIGFVRAICGNERGAKRYGFGCITLGSWSSVGTRLSRSTFTITPRALLRYPTCISCDPLTITLAG